MVVLKCLPRLWPWNSCLHRTHLFARQWTCRRILSMKASINASSFNILGRRASKFATRILCKKHFQTYFLYGIILDDYNSFFKIPTSHEIKCLTRGESLNSPCKTEVPRGFWRVLFRAHTRSHWSGPQGRHLNHSTENAKESRANAHPFDEDFVNLPCRAFGMIQSECVRTR